MRVYSAENEKGSKPYRLESFYPAYPYVLKGTIARASVIEGREGSKRTCLSYLSESSHAHIVLEPSMGACAM